MMDNRYKRCVAAILCIGASIVAPLATAQPDNADAVAELKALRTSAQKDKRALVASTLNLTDAEAKKFWPLYDAYQRAVDVANRERNVALQGLIAADKPVSDPYARNLAKELVAADDAEIRARKTLYNGVMRALPPKKAARYLQLETKIRAVQAYDVAATIPLIK